MSEEVDKKVSVEDLQVQMLDMQKQNQELALKLENVTQSLSEKNAQVEKLQESNQQLFLRASQGYQEQQKETRQEEWQSALAGEYADLLDDKQKQELKEIESQILGN